MHGFLKQNNTVRYWSVRVWYSRVSPRERLPRIQLPIDQSRAEQEVQVAGERRVSLRFTCDTRAQTFPEYMYSSRTVGGVISVTLLRCVSENGCCAFTDERVALHHESDLWRKRRSLNDDDDDVYSAVQSWGGGLIKHSIRGVTLKRQASSVCQSKRVWPLTPDPCLSSSVVYCFLGWYAASN